MTASAKVYRVLSCLKVFLIAFTVLFLCAGILFLATGIYAMIRLGNYDALFENVDLSLVPYVLCGTGFAITISGLVGFISAVRDNKCMVNCYCLLLGLVFFVEIAGGIVAIIFMEDIPKSLEIGLTNALNGYAINSKTLMDQTQMEWQCCGVYGYEDWFNTTWVGKTTQCGTETHYTIPLSCCKTQQSSESTVTIAKPCFCGNQTDIDAINQNGCLTTVFGSDGETIRYLIIATFGMAALQLIGITLTICIYQRLREINYRRY